MSRLRHAIAAASAGSSGLVAGSAEEDDGDESFSSEDATGSDSDLGSGKTRGLRHEKRRDVVRPLLQTGENVVVMLTQTM